jgi:hypothetical protein
VLKFIFSILFSITLVSPANQVDVETLKAVYLERFTRFVEWPESMDDDMFRIQVIGDKQLAKVFEKVFREIDIKGKSVIVYSDNDGYSKDFNPHAVYVSDKNAIKEVLNEVKHGPVLIVSEVRDGAKMGAMINIVLKDSKLRFEINEKAMHDSPLYVSYRLKKAALRVIASAKE